MNKFKFMILAICLLFCTTAEAKTYKIAAYTLYDISTLKENERFITLQLPATQTIGDDIYMQEGAFLRLLVTETVNSKRGKRDAYLKVKPIAYSIPSQDHKIVKIDNIEMEAKIKKYDPMDFKSLAINTSISIVGHVANIPGLSQGVAAIKGAVDPIEGKTRLASAGIKAYESTPLVYANKGKELIVKSGELVKLEVKRKEIKTENTEKFENLDIEINTNLE